MLDYTATVWRHKHTKEFLVFTGRTTHTGHHVNTQWTGDIERATLLAFPPPHLQTVVQPVKVRIHHKVTILESPNGS